MGRNVRKRGLALLLCLVMVVSLLPTMSAFAEDDPEVISSGMQVTEDGVTADDGNDLRLEKSLIDNKDGTYSIELDGYANAEIIDEQIQEKVPTDFVIVVDQSGSMDTRDMPSGAPTVHNNEYLETVADGAYYYKDGDNYYRVYGVKDYLFRYYPANYWYVGDMIERYGLDTSWFMGNTEANASLENRMYFREVVDGTTYYQPITMEIRGLVGAYAIRFHFNSKMTNDVYWFDREVQTYNGNVDSPWYHNVTGGTIDPSWSVGLGWPNYGTIDGAVQRLYGNDNDYTYSEVEILGWKAIHTGMLINYPMYDRHVGYTKLCYRDVNGVEHEVPSNQNGGQSSWEFCDANEHAITTNDGSARPTYSGLYTFAGTTDRMTALKGALNEFTQAVANETDSFGAVDNRIAIVGFSSEGYNNTELLTGENLTVRNNNGVQKNNATTSDYATALVDATNGTVGTVNSKLDDAVDAITANGGTQPEDGLNMAYQILTNRGEDTTYTIRSGEHAGESVERNTVVIFFTDGRPGNYVYSDQYTDANEVVEEALNIKQYNETTIFSIGVFGESDGNPLTYEHATASNSAGEDPNWKYLGGWMESYHDTYYPYAWHCLRRQWRPNNAEGYTETANDTIFDYMSVVSSNYPDAEDFIAPTWLTGGFSGNYIAATDGVRHKDTAEATNEYYRMASNQDTLISAFLQAITMNNEEITIDSNTSLDERGVLTDKVNTVNFDVTGENVTVTAKVVNIETNEIDQEATDALVYEPTVGADGTVTVTGFDYSGNALSKKLVVTISGLEPKKVGELESNDGYATITDDDGDVQARTTSPVLTLGDDHKVVKFIDFNMIADIDTDVSALKETRAPGGTFNWAAEGEDLTFTPNISTTGNAWDASAFSGVNQTMYRKGAAWNQAVVIPAASVYIADNLKERHSDFTDDGQVISGYDAAVVETAPPEITAVNTKDSRTITFTGTGIDIYCTTDDASGWISANLYSGTSVPEPGTAKDEEGNTIYTGDKALQSQLVKNNSVDTHYGCPTIRFKVPTCGTYTVKINTSAGSNYKFEGVRIYHPLDQASQEMYYDEAEQAKFTRVRDILLAADEFNNAIVDEKQVSGAIFVEVKGADNNPEKTTTVDAETYRDNGPRGEVYLAPHQAIAFKVDTKAPVLIGMSSADGTAVDYAVTNIAEATRVSTGTITSTVDMYYQAQPDANGYICIMNNGDSGLLAITNVRATSEGATSFSVGQDVLDYILQFEQMLQNLDQDALKTIWNDSAVSAPKLLTALWQMLLNSLSQLFAGIDQW